MKKQELIIIGLILFLIAVFFLIQKPNSSDDEINLDFFEFDDLSDVNSNIPDLNFDIPDFNYYEDAQDNDVNSEPDVNDFVEPDDNSSNDSGLNCVFDDKEETFFCDNNIWRVRPTKQGIVWFDFFNAKENKWYLNKNNLNLVVRVKDSDEWVNSELSKTQPSVEIVEKNDDRIVLKYSYDFPNGARVFLLVTLKKNVPKIFFKAFKNNGSKKITGFQWHVTFGQAEAVDQLHFDGHHVFASKLLKPFPGGRFELQHLEYFSDLDSQEFFFNGKETSVRDKNNPWWMGRVLGLKQFVEWKTRMRPQDVFVFEARDVPWQPSWKIPLVTPWIEGLWFIRNDSFVEGDELVYGITNLNDYLP